MSELSICLCGNVIFTRTVTILFMGNSLPSIPHVLLFSWLSDECATSPPLSHGTISILLPVSCFHKNLHGWRHSCVFRPPVSLSNYGLPFELVFSFKEQ